MPRRLPILLAALALAAIVATVALSPRTLTATGVVVAVEAASLTDVRGFTLRIAGGRTIAFSLAALQNGVAFPPGHLAEHIGSGTPIVVTYREENGAASAIRLEDAPAPTPS
ncbi:MAG: hypothetical protein V4515_08505 [Chloroflexota bacterium]